MSWIWEKEIKIKSTLSRRWAQWVRSRRRCCRRRYCFALYKRKATNNTKKEKSWLLLCDYWWWSEIMWEMHCCHLKGPFMYRLRVRMSIWRFLCVWIFVRNTHSTRRMKEDTWIFVWYPTRLKIGLNTHSMRFVNTCFLLIYLFSTAKHQINIDTK